MFVVTVQFGVLPEYAESFLAAMTANAETSLRLEDGCRQFDVCLGDPTAVFLYEVYDSEAAFQLHLRTPHFLSFNEVTMPWIQHKTVATFHRVFPIAQSSQSKAIQ